MTDTTVLNRRALLLAGAGLVLVAAMRPAIGRARETPEPFEIELSEDQWRERLTAGQFNILRQHGTEHPYSSPLNDEHRDGVFACAGCGQELYSSDVKYDSRTGWPSFWEALAGAVGTSEDTSFMMVRTECHCARCGGHLGHIFNDGPPPTGKRHCINGLALRFIPA